METKNMKTKITINAVLLSVLAVLMFFSCDNPLTLGTKLDIEGPIVEISSPSQRKSVTKEFDLEGTVYDKSTIDRMVIYAVTSNIIFPRQWRYIGGAWQISDDYGRTWAPYEDAVWEGPANSGTWKIHVNMNFPGFNTEEGEYTFNVQAWDKAEFSDDNSFKAVVLIVDLNPPKVDISFPFIYRGNNALNEDPLKSLHEITNFGDEKENPAYLGKFITQEFDLKWQVDDINDVWSIDLRFYKFDEPIDNNPSTPLSDNYYYKFTQNLGAPPANVNPSDYIRPNGTVKIPDLSDIYDGSTGIFDLGGEVKQLITEKTTLKVVASCYDAAGNANQEKTIGYFIYWPLANKPWIDFKDMTDPVFPTAITEDTEDATFKVFPGNNIKATAYQAHGVKEVVYSVYECRVVGASDTSKGTLDSIILEPPIKTDTKISNTPSSPDVYGTIFAWQFDVPDFTGYYVVKAIAYSNKDKPSQEYVKLFRVNNITYPEFTTPVQPAATAPLFLAFDSSGTSFTISGTVADATEVKTLCLAWINPDSEDFKAMSQLSYFRAPKYPGWLALVKPDDTVPGKSYKYSDLLVKSPGPISTGIPYKEKPGDQSWIITDPNRFPYDNVNPNLLWKLNPTYDGTDEKNRRQYTFSQKINLSDLNIGMNHKPPLGTGTQNPLKSQVFLLRAENPDGQCTIITYAPKGDATPPAIKISKVEITGSQTATCYPNVSSPIQKFAVGDRIHITGRWREDSVSATGKLDLTTFFKNNFIITINSFMMNYNTNLPIGLPTLTVTKSTNPIEETDGLWDGTWEVTAIVGGASGNVPLSNLRDNLVIDAKTKDIGGNEASLTNSWIILSDNLQLTRISSEMDDNTYSSGEIIIFLEFSKPVNLASNVTGTPYLILSSNSGNTARAEYQRKTDQNSRQYFKYNIGNTDNTPTNEYLYVKGLWYDNGVQGTAYNGTTYPFSWTRGDGGSYEEVRITTTTGKNGKTKESTVPASPNQFYPLTLPTNGASDPLALTSSKHIKIDTTAPTVLSGVSGVSSTNPQRYYTAGDIYITVNFSEAVSVPGPTVPRLVLTVGNSTNVNTSSSLSDVTVNGSSVTFKYTITSGETSNGNDISVTGYTGTGAITDIAGNLLATNWVSSSSSRTLTGIKVETQPPTYPNVRLFTEQRNGQTGSQYVITSSVNDGTNNSINYGTSTQDSRNLVTVYSNDLWLSLHGQGNYSYKYAAMEYSLDGGSNWLTAPNTVNDAFQLPKTSGIYTITARQKDAAGLTGSQNPNTITFTWDPGDIVSRIASDNANGIYSQYSDPINITVYFRKTMYFANGTASITIDAKRSGNNIDLTRVVTAGTPYDSLTFTYTVQNGDGTNGNNLDVVSTAITGVDAYDKSAAAAPRVRFTSLTLPTGTNKLGKELKVQTGSLTASAPSFVLAGASGTSANEADGTFHGIRKDDGSYWTTLKIPFNQEIIKGSGMITITPPSTNGSPSSGDGVSNYRLPAVLTEAQYNRFKTVANIDQYYEKSTNGYINGTGSDTSTKYVLKFNYDPLTVGGTTGLPGTFYDAFRAAETISINVNAAAVTIDGDKKTLNIRLTGSNAPQIPGVAYSVKWDAGIVNDKLGNSIGEQAGTPVTLGGVAKPFIRIKKTQDTITTTTGSQSQPRLVATQPLTTSARIDCRTPNSAITYTAASATTSVGTNDFTPATAGSQNNWIGGSGTGNPPLNPTNNAQNNNTNMLITRPINATATSYTNSSPITLGGSPDINNVQGYQWWARARATATVGGTAYNTDDRDSDEVAYRTVLSLLVRQNDGNITAGTTAYSIMGSGDQIWLRGGDAIGSSSIPGFPFTWEDDWTPVSSSDSHPVNLSGKRAGIRLMSFVRGANLNCSLWRFVTWDMNAPAYVDFIRGVDSASIADVAWQYGPKQWTYQRDGWTSLKTSYPVYAGKHRWCDFGYNRDWAGASRGYMNFSNTLSERATINTADYPDASSLNKNP